MRKNQSLTNLGGWKTLLHHGHALFTIIGRIMRWLQMTELLICLSLLSYLLGPDPIVSVGLGIKQCTCSITVMERLFVALL